MSALAHPRRPRPLPLSEEGVETERTRARVPFWLLPVGVLCALAEARVIAEVHALSGGMFLAANFALMFTLTIGFVYYVLRWHGDVHRLPFVWTLLAIAEFIVSPAHDILYKFYPLTSQRFVWTMGRALLSTNLFLAGTWAAVVLFTRATRRARYPIAHVEPASIVVSPSAFIVLPAAAVVSLAAQLYVLATAGVLGGEGAELTYARGAGFIGATMFTPLWRLSDLGAATASWMSLRAEKAATRRSLFVLSLFCLGCSLVMPTVMLQRNGMIQSLLFWGIPQLAAGRFGWNRLRGWVIGVFPIVVAFLFFVNTITTVARELDIKGKPVAWGTVIDEIPEHGAQATHFRHVWVLADLIGKGIDEPSFGGFFPNLNPMVGDFAIIAPRVIVDDKPATTMEVVNTVALQTHFGALDRGKSSVYTASLWVQLHVQFGALWMLPTSFGIALLGLWLWHALMKRAAKPMYLFAAILVWMQFGWLSWNVVLTTLEFPGLVLGVAILYFTGIVKSTARDSGATGAEPRPVE